MKLILLLFLIITLSLHAEDEDKKDMQAKIDSVYEFVEVINLEVTPVKNQNRTGTCWTFAGNSFLESELMRMGKGQYDLSEMFIVRNMYPEKADKYVRYHGKYQFGQGALTHDVFRTIDKYGVITEEAYSSRPENDYLNHSEMAGILKAMLDQVVATSGQNRTTKWKQAYESVLDVYMGKVPETFMVDGKEFTPKEFADYLGLKKENYVDITSFTHHPFYEKFVLEVPDNFSQGYFHNVKMNEMLDVAVYAVENGFSVDWGADVSEKSFESDYGLAIDPADMEQMILDKEEIKWDSIYTEINITQEKRQEDFDKYLTTDDHGMHIVGIAKDKLDRRYFIVKNSWGVKNRGRDGYLYVSFPYFMHKTTSISIHKDGVPKEIKSKLNM